MKYCHSVLIALLPWNTQYSTAFPTQSRTKAKFYRLTTFASTSATTSDESQKPERKYLDVPFDSKDAAKALGARWDSQKKAWYNPDPTVNLELDRWAVALSSSRSYLSVPFDEKDEAKSLGARWDASTKQWYDPTPSATSVLSRWKCNTEEVQLVGEDRTFGGNLLFVDLIPSSCWFTNVRYCVDPLDWDRLRRKVYSRADNRCECCGSSQDGLEAHERWNYDEKKKVQKLVRLVALCRECHQTTHFGLAQIKGKAEVAANHLHRMRGFNAAELSRHIGDAFELYHDRCQYTWDLDLSLITSNGMKLATTRPERSQRKEISRSRLDSQEQEDPKEYSQESHWS